MPVGTVAGHDARCAEVGMNLTNPAHLELAVISSVLLDTALLRQPEVRALQPTHLRHYSGLWAIIRELDAEGTEPNIADLARHMHSPRWPAGFTLSDLMGLQAYSVRPQEVPGAARGIVDAYRRDQGLTVAGTLARALGDHDADHLAALTEAHTALTGLIGDAPRDSTEHVDDDLDAAIDRILNPQQHRGVTTGLPSLDAVLGGWQPGTLNILAARPSMGKSALCGQFAQAAAFGGPSQPARVLMFSLEDGPTVTRMRTLSRLSSVPLQHGAAPAPSAAERLQEARRKLATLRGRWLLDTEAHLDGIVSACWRAHAEEPLGLVIVDQLSHVVAEAPRTRADNRVQLYGYITKTLKREVAQRLGVPVILASQLSREGAKVDRPDLMHLRDSGELEQDADTVTFIHRPDYYDPTDSPGMAELLVRKNRNGPTKTVHVQANLKLFKFWEGDL